MKKSKFSALILSVLLLLSTFNTSVFAFTDTRGHWASTYIDELSSKNLINGYNDGSFKPNSNMTRVEFYSLINRLAKYDKTYPVSFSDVSTNDWFYNEVAKGIKAGYITPTTGKLNPNSRITRQEVMYIIGRVYNLGQKPGVVNKFKDKGQISPQSKGYVGALVSDNIVSGYPDGTIGPNKPISRGEVSKIVVQSINKYGKPDKNTLSDSEIIFGQKSLYE